MLSFRKATKDEKQETIEDILSLLPDDSIKRNNEELSRSENSAAASTFKTDDENLDFGGYQPSCLSISASSSTLQRRSLSSFIVQRDNFITNENKPDKVEKEHHPSISVESVVDQVELLKHMHLLEIEARDKQAQMEEEKDLETEREAVLAMKEQLSEADAALRKELQEHTLRMQTESEDMARQKRELEHARNIAAEIALEVENSQRELEMYKNLLSKNVTDAKPIHDQLQERGPHNEVAYAAARGLFDFERKAEHLELSRRYEHHRPPYSAADVVTSSLYVRELLSKGDSPQTEALLGRELEEDIYYLKSQEDFLIQAEKALQNMEWAPLNGL